ncbi:MAG: LysM domain-containing protein [Actinomycetota bacterium]
MGAVPALGAVLASVGGFPAAAADAVPGTSPAADRAARHVAAPGDTMWSIAQQHRGAISHADYVDALIRLNGGVGIEVGQAVVLP